MRSILLLILNPKISLTMKLNSSLFITPILLFSLFLFISCGSDHDHGPTPVGLVLSASGSEIAMQDGTTVTYVDGNSIDLPLNGQLVVNIEFLSEDGDRYYPDTNDGYSLRVSADNNQILDITHPVNNNEWTFSLNGLTTGSSNLSFELWHVGHSDFESRPFQVTVSEITPE